MEAIVCVLDANYAAFLELIATKLGAYQKAKASQSHWNHKVHQIGKWIW